MGPFWVMGPSWGTVPSWVTVPSCTMALFWVMGPSCEKQYPLFFHSYFHVDNKKEDPDLALRLHCVPDLVKH